MLFEVEPFCMNFIPNISKINNQHHKGAVARMVFLDCPGGGATTARHWRMRTDCPRRASPGTELLSDAAAWEHTAFVYSSGAAAQTGEGRSARIDVKIKHNRHKS